MQYHVIKKRLSSQVRAMLSNPTAGWDCHPQASAYADLQMLFGKDENVLELKALHGLVHHVYRHRTSYEIELEAGSDGAEQIEAHLEKIFEYENAPYDVDDLHVCQCRLCPHVRGVRALFQRIDRDDPRGFQSDQ